MASFGFATSDNGGEFADSLLGRTRKEKPEIYFFLGSTILMFLITCVCICRECCRVEEDDDAPPQVSEA